MVNCEFNGATKLAIQFQDALQRLDFPGFFAEFALLYASSGPIIASYSGR
jgi:hypothetical protein